MSEQRRRRHRRRSEQSKAELPAGAVGRSWVGHAVLGLLLVVAVAGGWHGWQTLQAGLRVKTLEREVRRLERRPEVEASLSVAALRARFEALGPAANAGEAELRSRLWWHLARLHETPAVRIAALREARLLLRSALSERAAWPYTWLLLAQVELALEPTGRDGAVAVGAALDLGVRGLRLQRQLLELRLQHEDRLPVDLRARLQQALRVGVRDHGSDLVRDLHHSDRQGWICADAELFEQMKAWCTSEGWPAPPES